ncbi:hypothetical protein ACFL6S_06595 [Candidatus Poribacteria bacterium]
MGNYRKLDTSVKCLTESDISCEKSQDIQEYSHFHELIDNLPYMMMTILGTVIFFTGIGSLWRLITAGLYVLYGIAGAFWIIVFVCPYCHYYDTRLCPCGYGKIAAKLRPKKSDTLFTEKYKRHIPVIVPLWIAPVIAGGISLILNFSLWILVLIVLFAVNSFIVLPLLSRKYGCAHCPQEDQCPWMRQKG